MGMAEAREFVCEDANGQNRLRNKCEAQRPTSICPALSFGYRNLINAARLSADFSFLTTSPAASALMVVCGPPAPDVGMLPGAAPNLLEGLRAAATSSGGWPRPSQQRSRL